MISSSIHNSPTDNISIIVVESNQQFYKMNSYWFLNLLSMCLNVANLKCFVMDGVWENIYFGMERKGLALLQYHIALFVLTEIDKDTPKTLGRDFIATTGGTTMVTIKAALYLHWFKWKHSKAYRRSQYRIRTILQNHWTKHGSILEFYFSCDFAARCELDGGELLNFSSKDWWYPCPQIAIRFRH